MNLIIVHFLLFVIYLPLIKSKIIHHVNYQKRIKKDDKYIESILNRQKLSTNTKSYNFIYISKINNISLFTNNKILIPVLEEITNDNIYNFKLSLILQSILLNDDYKYKSDFKNNVNLTIVINKEECYLSSFILKGYKKLDINCKYNEIIDKECKIQIKVNNDIYKYDCFNSNTKSLFLPFKIMDCIFHENDLQIQCDIKEIDSNDIDLYEFVNIYVNSIKVNYWYEKISNNRYIFEIQNKTNLIFHKGDKISISFFKKFILFEKDFIFKNKINANLLIDEAETEDDIEIKEKDKENLIRKLIYGKYNFYENPIYYYWNNIPFYSTEIINTTYSKTLNVINTQKNKTKIDFNYMEANDKYFISSFYNYTYNNNNKNKGSKIDMNNINECVNFTEMNKNIFDKNKIFIKAEYNEYYFFGQQIQIKLNIFKKDIVNYIIKFINCGYKISMYPNSFYIKEYSIDYENNHIVLYIHKNSSDISDALNEKNYVNILLNNINKYISLANTNIVIVKIRIDIYDISFDDNKNYINFNMNNISKKYNNFIFDKIICVYNDSSYSEYFYNSFINKFSCLINSHIKSKFNVTFYSLFINNHDLNIFFIKEIEIDTQKNNNNYSDINTNYEKILYNSSFYNKTMYENDFIINYTLNVNYENMDDNDMKEIENKYEDLKNEINEFKLSYKLKDFEYYYIKDLSKSQFYLINKPIIKFFFEELSLENNYYCLINNKYIIHSFYQKVKENDNEYELNCILNFPWIINYLYPNKLKVCIYNNINTLILEKTNFFHCKYISFLDDSFSLQNNENDEIVYKKNKNIITFNSKKLSNIYNIINSHGYIIECLIINEKEEEYLLPMEIDTNTYNIKCILNKDINIKGHFQIYIILKNDNISDELMSKYIGTVLISYNLLFNYYTENNNYIINNSRKQQIIKLKTIEGYKFNKDLNGNGYCLFKSEYYSYLSLANIINEQEINCFIEENYHNDTYFYDEIYDIYYVYDFDYIKNNFTYYHKAINSPIKVFKLPLIREQDIYIDFYDEYFYIEIYYFNDKLINNDNYYILILNNTLYYDCYQRNNIVSYNKLKCSNNVNKYPMNLVYHDDNNENMVNFVIDVYISEFNYFFNNVKINLFFLMPFSPLYINEFKDNYLSSLDNIINIKFRSNFTNIFYKYSYKNNYIERETKIYFFDSEKNDIISDSQINKIDNEDNLFQFDLNINNLIQSNEFINEIYYFIYYKTIDGELNEKLPLSYLKKIYVINFSNIKIINAFPNKDYYNNNKITLKCEISNFIYESKGTKIHYNFFLQNKDHPNYTYKTDLYKCQKVSLLINNQYTCLIQFKNEILYYPGKYCIGISLHNSTNIKYYCNEIGAEYANNDINIFLYSISEIDNSNIIYINLISIKPYIFTINTKISIIFNSHMMLSLNEHKIYPMIDYDIIMPDCKVNNNIINCVINENNLNIGYHTISITDDLNNKNIISNSVSFILIEKPVIKSYESIVTFPTGNTDKSNSIKIIFESFFLNDNDYLLLNNIKCRFKSYEMSKDIKMPFMKDTKGLMVDKNNIICYLENNYFIGDYLYIELNIGDYNSNYFIDFYSSSSSSSFFISQRFINIISYEPKNIFIDINEYNKEYVPNDIIIYTSDLSEYINNGVSIDVNCFVKNNINDLYLISKAISFDSEKIICGLPIMLIKSIILKDKNNDNDKENQIQIDIIINKIIQKTNRISIKILNNSEIIDVYPREFSKNGKISVNIYGNYFYSFIKYECKFYFSDGKYFITEAIFINNNNIKCPTKDISDLNLSIEKYLLGNLIIMNKSIKNNIIKDNNFEIKVFNDIELYDLSPNFVFLHNSYGIIIKGNNFLNVKSLMGKISYQKYSILIKPIYIDSNTLFLYSPTTLDFISVIDFGSNIPLELSLSISNNNYEYDSKISLLMYPYPILLSVEPSYVYHQGENLILKGYNFNNKLTHCLFVNEKNDIEQITKISSIENNIIKCESPYFIPFDMNNYKDIYVRIELMLISENIKEIFNLQKIYLEIKKLIYIDQNNIIPNEIIINNDQIVVIKLDKNNLIPKEIIESDDFKITLCDKEVSDIKYIDFNSFSFKIAKEEKLEECVLILLYKNKRINISNNKIYFFDFSFKEFKISPILGDYKGGTLISVYNKNEYNKFFEYKCLFRNIKNDIVTYVKAYLVQENIVTCMTEPHEVGEYYFSLLINNLISSYPSYEIIFTFYTQIRVVNMHPLFISKYYKCLINLETENVIYENNDDLVFKIGKNNFMTKKDNNIEKIDENGKKFNFFLPQNLEEGKYSFSISNNNQNYYYSNYDISVIDNDKIEINLSHSYIPFNTEGVVYVHGKNFDKYIIDKDNMKVKFGEEEQEQKLIYKNNTLLYFEYPKFIQNDNDVNYKKYIITFKFSECLFKKFYPEIILYKKERNFIISPLYFESYNLKNIILIKSSNSDELKTTSCNFNNIKIEKTYYIEDNLFFCHMPILPIGAYPISFSSNDVDYVFSENENYQKINIIKNFKLITIKSNIISNKYQEDIIIYGNNFVDYKNYKCRWTNIKPLSKNTIITEGEYINSHRLKCLKPKEYLYEMYDKNDYESIYTIEIVLDNFDTNFIEEKNLRTNSNYDYLLIYIYQYAPNGFFIDVKNHNEIKKCPKGYFCNRNNVSFKNIYKHLCYYGYYMIYEGRYLCLNCPKNGFDCIHKEFQNPLIDYTNNKCPKGFICTQYGISHIPCPTGFICNSDYSINPIPCPVGYFCFEGTSEIHSVKNNYQTPQLCIIGHICPLKSTSPLGIGECISGHYCPDEKSGPIPCPPRSYCPERGNIKPILCEEGFYNDKYGMEKCSLCPIGFICPYKGLYKPIECPQGYYCDKEGLIYPYKFCNPGSICASGVKFGFEDKICFYSRECDSNYYDESPLEGSAYLEINLNYSSNYHTVLCCYNSNKFHEMFRIVDQIFYNSTVINLVNFMSYDSITFYSKFYSNLLTKYSFEKYYSSFQKNNINGYQLSLDFERMKTIETSLSILNIYIPFHKSILFLIFSQMLETGYNFSPERCPRKYYCLEGVATLIADSKWDYTPKLCPKNFYCIGGDRYQSGTGRCSRDFFCPLGTDIPSFTSEGSVILGNVTIETECYPGTFITSESGSKDCLDCPDGYDCSKKGAYWPVICKQGYYRTIYETCVPCPKGTFSFVRGLQDSGLCSSCPPGTVCQNMGINNSEDIKICDEGYVCGMSSGIYKRENCPKGFFCENGTTPDTKYNLKCPEGYICSEGIGGSNSYGTICPVDHYCPKGTGYIVIEGKDETIIEYNMVPRCPFGTSSYEDGGLKTIIECKIIEKHHIFMNFDNSELQVLALSKDQNTFNNDESIDEKDILILEEIDENVLSYYHYFKNLDLIDFYLSKYDSNIELDYDLNTNREPLISFSPINLTSSYPPYKTEEIINVEFTKYLKIYKHYFKIEKNSYVLITIDLRHIISPLNKIFFIYGIDWDITFEKVISKDNNIKLDMPTTFLSKENDKSNVHEFNVYSFEDTILTFNINIYNGIYFPYISYFKDIATLVYVYPNRAELNTNKFFGIFLFKEDIETISFPVNIPLKNTTYNSIINLDIKEKVKKNIISYNLLNINNNSKVIKNVIREGFNNFPQTDNYWGISSSIGMTHIPFISNCKGYGKYIHLWSLLEQNPQCELKPLNETVYIKDFSFGLHAVGDNCNISLECIYDENVGTLSNYKFWYESPTGFSLFKITRNPINLEDLDDPTDLELIDVKIQNSLENDEIPKNIILEINYFQVSKTLKRIIDAKIIFNDPWSKSEIQKLNDSVNYTFNIIFNPYTHTDLMITFALSSKFYIILYLFVGCATTSFVLFSFLFHSIIYRNKNKSRPEFKMKTFFPIILPPVIIGFFISIIPIFLEIIILHLVLIGKLLFKKAKLFNLTNAKGEECDSFFDFIGYMGESDLDNIRKGRLGTAFLIFGIFLTYYHTQLVIPNVPIKANKSFDNNRFDFINWKRGDVYYIDFVLSIINVYYTILSFCNLWSENIWYFILSYKIIGIIAENYCEYLFQEQLLIAGFGCLFNIMQNMITFGASDLIDFLKSSVIEQVILIIEKIYIEAFTNYVKEHWDEYYRKFKDFIGKFNKFDVDLEFETKDNDGEEEDEDEAIILEEEIENEDKKENNLLEKDKNSKEDKNINNDINSDSNSSEKKKDNEEIEIEEYLDRYKGFASDLLSYFYNLVFYFILWITREENYILDYYDISDENFIYFYFFSIISVFFSIINDIIMHNLLEGFSNIQMHDFLDYFNYRYHIRTENWALDQQEINLELEPSSIKMFKIGFSSQYYYLKTIYVSGLLFIVIGIVTLILNEINPFLDIATPFIILFVYVTLKIIYVLSSYIIHILKIWEVEKEEISQESKNKKILKELNDNKSKFGSKSFEEDIKEKEQIIEVIEENLKTERLILEITRNQFIEQNKQWLRNEIQNIITPRTLLQNKKKLIEVLGKKYSNDIKADINILPVKFYSPVNSSNENDDDESEFNSDDFSYKRRKQNFKTKTKNNNIIKDILRIWKNRAILNKKLMKIMRLTILEMKDKKCCICGIENSLKVIYEGNIINTFISYLKEKNETMNNFSEIDFKIYFKNIEKNNVKTKCISCS